jgi:uncharacterized membrane protein
MPLTDKQKQRVFTAIYLAVVDIALIYLVSGLALQDWYLLSVSGAIMMSLLFLQQLALIKTIAKLQSSIENGRFLNS